MYAGSYQQIWFMRTIYPGFSYEECLFNLLIAVVATYLITTLSCEK